MGQRETEKQESEHELKNDLWPHAMYGYPRWRPRTRNEKKNVPLSGPITRFRWKLTGTYQDTYFFLNPISQSILLDLQIIPCLHVQPKAIRRAEVSG